MIMKLNSHLLLGIFFSILFVGCEKNDSPTPPIEGSRTVLVYIVADKNGLDENIIARTLQLGMLKKCLRG